MGTRLSLQTKLQAVIGTRLDNKPNVYFQPPESVRMNYPCIVYQRSNGETSHADDMPYIFRQKYDITIIDANPDSLYREKMAMAFPGIEYNRFFVEANLNHDVFTLYY